MSGQTGSSTLSTVAPGELQRWNFQCFTRTLENVGGHVKRCADECLRCTVPYMDGLDEAVARRLRELLQERGLRHEDLARGMTDLGFRWTGNRVTQVVTGRRPMSLLEVAGVCCVLHTAVEDLLLGATGVVDLPGGSVDVDDVRQALGGGHAWAARRATFRDVRDALADHAEATVKAARRLEVTPAEVDEAARALWGQVLAGERDRRVGSVEGESPRALQARRGHVTRALLDELRQYLEGRRAAGKGRTT